MEAGASGEHPAALAVHTRGLSLNYGTLRALDALDLDVARGQLFALLGPNGAGKSTTIGILTTLLAQSAGVAVVAGWDVVRQPREVRRSMGVVFQEGSLDDRLTARENLDLHAAMHGIPTGDRARKVIARLETVGLASAANQRVRTLSGGMKRRLEIARALLHEPEIVILDEPTVGLDPQTRRSVWDQLASMAATRERTVFVTTHYMDEAERCDDVAIVDHGKLVARGSPAELVARTGGERLVVRCEDDARAAELARGLGWRVHPGQPPKAGLVIEGQRPEIMLAQLAQAGAGIREAEIVRPTLEDVFVELTGRGLRDVHDEEAGRHAAMRTNLRARGRR
ncbi:MAG: ATP-binding cassette domain-containing protein [Polyangiaceae bacterium]|jgi:ABC-2 type transport system ATP-binding protein